MALEEGKNIGAILEAQMKEFLPAPEYGSRDSVVQDEHGANTRGTVRADLRQRFRRAENPFDHDLDLPARLLAAPEPRLDDTGVVEDEYVAGPDQIEDVAKAPVAEFPSPAVEVQQSRRTAFRGRHLRDQLLRQLVIKIIEAHHLDYMRRDK